MTFAFYPSRKIRQKNEINLQNSVIRVLSPRFARFLTPAYTLPDNVDENGVKATFKDGVLSLQIPKTAETKPKAIEVKVE